MKIAFASSEVVPYAKTGGLADVAGALPIEIAKLGHNVKVFMPKYYSVDEYKFNLHYDNSIGEILVRVAGHPRPVHVFKGDLPNSKVEINFIHCPHYFHRHQLYTNDMDEDNRFILFSKSVIEILQRKGWAPDVIHCNDWQTGLIPLYLRDNYNWDRMFDRTATVFTIHNIGYQGRFGRETLDHAEIRGDLFYPDGPVEYYGDVNFMKAAIRYSDIINTVSETYAKELLTPEYGSGMDNELRKRSHDFYGVLNGVDYSIWNPETDKHLPFHYSLGDLSGKQQNKKFLLDHFYIPFKENVPLIGLVSRLVPQKGFDLIEEAMPELIRFNAQWVVLGNGEHQYEYLFQYLHDLFPDKFGFYRGYNNDLAHLIEAGADIFLMPSKYEPCGLNQIYSLKYGTVPVVRKTGGLADTVHDWNEFNGYGFDTGTGFSFYDYSAPVLVNSVQRALNDFYNKPVWKKIQSNGMIKDYSWHASAEKYVELYNRAISKRKI
ncbi:MAG: glycogen synthase GlgA [bacterium]